LKIFIDQKEIYDEVEIRIKCRIIDESLEKLISELRLFNSTISGKKDGRMYIIKLEDVLYFDTVDEKFFIYTAEGVYETSLRLYEIEERFAETSMMRISKSVILNINKINYVSPLLNGRIEAVLQNGEKIVISRQYVSAFKRKLGY
jgi:Response regulator of the LytR/AlgR family